MKLQGDIAPIEILPSLQRVVIDIAVFIGVQEMAAYYIHRYIQSKKNMFRECYVIICKTGCFIIGQCTRDFTRNTTNGLLRWLCQHCTTTRSITWLATFYLPFSAQHWWNLICLLIGSGWLGPHSEHWAITAATSCPVFRLRVCTTFITSSSTSVSVSGVLPIGFIEPIQNSANRYRASQKKISIKLSLNVKYIRNFLNQMIPVFI